MKKSKFIFLLSFMLLLVANISKAQSISCSELYRYVKKEGGYPSTYTCYGSSFLIKAERYTVDGTGVVALWMKTNDYDYTGTPYIYCGISSMTWSYFTSEGATGSWGKAFHKYIKGNNCDCN